MSQTPQAAAQTNLEPSDYSSYIAGWKQRRQREKEEIEKRRAHARQIAAQAVEILEQHGATKVILFGSVLDHTSKLDSDIDLARCRAKRGGSGFSSSARS